MKKFIGTCHFQIHMDLFNTFCICMCRAYCKILHKYCKYRVPYAFWPHHCTQNDWTPIQQVMAHWWLPCHSTLDLFANSVWSQPWLRIPPRHYKPSQWRAESGQQNKRTSCHYFGLYGDTPLTPNHWSVCIIVGSALCLWIKFAYFSEEWQWFIWTESLQTRIWKNNQSPYQSGQREITYPAKLISDNFRSVDRGHGPKNGIWNNPMCLV